MVVKMTKQHDYTKTKKFLYKWQTELVMMALNDGDEGCLATILHALKLAEKLEQEPSRGMCSAGMSPFMASLDPMFNKNEPTAPIFKAMLTQAKKEIE